MDSSFKFPTPRSMTAIKAATWYRTMTENGWRLDEGQRAMASRSFDTDTQRCCNARAGKRTARATMPLRAAQL